METTLYVARFWTARRRGVPIIRIALGRPRGVSIAGTITELAPHGLLGLEHDEFATRYRAQLDKLGVDRQRQLLAEQADTVLGSAMALCCYEDLRKPDQWCHRIMWRDWWYEQTGERVADLDEPDATDQPQLWAVEPQDDWKPVLVSLTVPPRKLYAYLAPPQAKVGDTVVLASGARGIVNEHGSGGWDGPMKAVRLEET